MIFQRILTGKGHMLDDVGIVCHVGCAHADIYSQSIDIPIEIEDKYSQYTYGGGCHNHPECNKQVALFILMGHPDQ